MDDPKAVFRAYVNVWESGRLDMLADLLHPAYVGHPATGDRDAEGLARRIAEFRALFPDVRFAVEDQFTEGDRVATRMRARATRAADGVRVTLLGLNISRVADGRIAEEWMAWEVVPDADV